MELPSGVSWLCVLLFWGCIYFPLQKGHNIAHGYYLSENAQPSNQFHSGAFLNPEEEEEDQTQNLWHQNFVSHQEEPIQDRGNHVGSVTGFDEMTEQHRPGSGQEEDESLVSNSARSVQKYENMSSGHQHPFGVLLKEHTPETPVEGISFPTINDFRQFIDTVKSSFLIPGSNSGGYFQTARETLKNEFTSGAQSVDGESSESNSVKEGSVHYDDSENEVRSEPMLEKSQPDESVSLVDPVDHTAGLISHNDIQDSGMDSALYYNTEATEYGLGQYGSDPDEQHDESASYNFPEQKHAGSLLEGGYFLNDQVTSSPVNPPDGPSQDLSHYSSRKYAIKPLTSEKIIKQPKYSSHTADPGYQPPGDFKLGNQRDANLLYPQQPPSLTSYGKSVFVNPPRTRLYISSNVSKHRERPAHTQSLQRHQPSEPQRVTVTNLLSPQEPPSSDSYSEKVFVNPPRAVLYIPSNVSKHRERPAQPQSLQRHQPSEPQRATGSNLLYPREHPSLDSNGKIVFVNPPKAQLYIPSNVSKHRERPSQTQSLQRPQPSEPQKATGANLLYPQQPPSLTSYGKSIFVDTPRTQLYLPSNPSKHRERSVQMHRPTVGKESKDIDDTLTILPASTGSERSPQSSHGHKRVEASRSNDPQDQVFSRKQPIKSYLLTTVNPPSLSPDSERPVSNVRNQGVTVSRPSIISGQAGDERSEQSEQNQDSVVQESQQVNDLVSIPTTYGLDSTLSGNSSAVSDVDVTSPINFVPTSEPKKAFSREFENELLPRDVNSKRFPSGVRNLQGLFSYLQKHGPPHTFIQQKLPASVNTNHDRIRIHHLFKPVSTSKGPVSTLPGVSWRNDSNNKKLLPQKYRIQSRNGYLRGKVSLSKTRYSPYQHTEVNSAEHPWKKHRR